MLTVQISFHRESILKRKVLVLEINAVFTRTVKDGLQCNLDSDDFCPSSHFVVLMFYIYPPKAAIWAKKS